MQQGRETGVHAQVQQTTDISIPVNQEYYYTVTGEIVVGKNHGTDFQEFQYDTQRFKISEQLQNRTQALGWEKLSNSNEIISFEELLKQYTLG